MKRSIDEYARTTVDAINVMLRPRLLWPGLLLVVFIVSAGASMTLPRRRPAVIWFPDSRSVEGSRSKAELRFVPRGRGVADEAASIVEELLLGPLDASMRPVTMPDANLRSVIRSGKMLFVDISSDILFGRTTDSGVSDPPPLPPRVALGYIGRTLGWNFPLLTSVVTIDGLEPSWGPPEGSKQAKNE